jgi:ribosomal protein S7
MEQNEIINFHIMYTTQEITNHFFRSLTKKGKRHTAEILFSKLFRLIKKDYKKNPLLMIALALKNVKPLVGFRSVRLSGSSYTIPYFLKNHEQVKLSFLWFLVISRVANSDFLVVLAKELSQASLKQGGLIKKSHETNTLAYQNRVFAQYRWF